MPTNEIPADTARGRAASAGTASFKGSESLKDFKDSDPLKRLKPNDRWGVPPRPAVVFVDQKLVRTDNTM